MPLGKSMAQDPQVLYSFFKSAPDGMFPNKVELKIESNKYVFCGEGAKKHF